MEQARAESKEFLSDITMRDQRMMFAILTIVITADSYKKLQNDTEAVMTIAREHVCNLSMLWFQQWDGLMTALPFGVRKSNVFRTLTTECLAVFMPFTAQEVYDDRHGIYYGQNEISQNMLIADRRNLLNGNSFILGVSGSVIEISETSPNHINAMERMDTVWGMISKAKCLLLRLAYPQK